MIELEIRNPTTPISAGETLLYYQIEDDTETLIGVFYAEAPTIASKTTVHFFAYDGIAKLAVDFSEWLLENQDKFAMSLRSLVEKAVEIAGLPGISGTFANQDIMIPAFTGNDITARQIVIWAAQIAGCFCRCDTDGKLLFDWYAASTVSIAPSGNTATHKYIQDSLTVSSYQTDKIQRVQIKHDENDVGTIYPEDADGNVFTVSGNALTSQFDSDTLSQLAQSLYTKLKDVTYTPLSFTIKRTATIKAGDIISVTDGNWNVKSTYVMKVYLDASGTQVSSTGEKNYSDKATVSSEKYTNLPGKVLLLKKSIDGLSITAKELKSELEYAQASIELASDQLKTYVQSNFVTTSEQDEVVRQLQSLISQSAQQVELVFSQIDQRIDGVSGDLTDYKEEIQTFIRATAEGVEIGKSDSPYSALLTNDRLEFRDSGTVVAYISNNKMHITDLEVTHSARLTCWEFMQRSNGNGIIRYRRLS